MDAGKKVPAQEPKQAEEETKLVGVQIVFRKGNDVYCAWLNTNTQGGISWSGKPPEWKSPGKGNKPVYRNPPTQADTCTVIPASGTSKQSTGEPAPPICWWDGTKWDCGEM